MTKHIKIKLLPDGRIEALTHDIKGKACLDYLPLLEDVLEAKAVDSNFTSEYYEEAEQASTEQASTTDETTTVEKNIQEL